MTPELEQAIFAAVTLQEIEDIYRPYRPKRRTRATIAKEKGLEPLADFLIAQEMMQGTIEEIAQTYINEEKGVTTVQEALQGAMDIIAESVSDNAEIRKAIREKTLLDGTLLSKGRKGRGFCLSRVLRFLSRDV